MKAIAKRSCWAAARREDIEKTRRKNKLRVWYGGAVSKKNEAVGVIGNCDWLRRAGSVSLSWLAAGLLLTVPAAAVSTENLLFLEAWRGVNRAYVDNTFNHQNWLKVHVLSMNNGISVRQLRERYLKNESMTSRKETYAAIEKMLSTLNDPFTRFLDPARYDALKGGTKGVVTGVGLEVAFSPAEETNALMVVAPAPGGPAARAGVMPGDVLLEIDGVSVVNNSLYAVGEKLQGDRGSEVDRTRDRKSMIGTGISEVKEEENWPDRDRLAEEVTFVMNADRTVLQARGISSTKTGDSESVGYIQILRFTDQTAYDVEDDIHNLKVAPVHHPSLNAFAQNEGIDRLILDLRNNGGGSFPAALAVSRMLLDNGDIVLIADAKGVKDIISAEGASIDGSTPMTVIINRGTASASEVLSGALQDNQRAIIVGESSFGKGLIQTLVPLSDGSAVTITTAKYQTPSGKDINGIGIQPDIVLSSSTEVPYGDNNNFCSVLKTSLSSSDFLEEL